MSSTDRSGDEVTEVTEAAAALPRPTTARWQPLRLGLVDLFYYDDEQFWFHDGRLLLRGNNGTGKSKVLALTLPFLLDGSVLPRRVEPDADPKKRMEWNLLLGGAHPSTERTGYSWVEFGRVDADGLEQFVTLGIGLKAASGRGIVKSWYFTTTRRIGDLRLLGPDRVVLTQERLREELEAGASGQVHTTREAYRRAVDEALFRLGEERYAALVDLLIQLRQPQLSKKPDEKALSTALTEALAPLDQAVVADVAESFRSLEEERVGIAEAKETLAAAEAFLHHYRGYARVATRRRTTAVRVANSDFEHAGRQLREAEEQLVAADREVERLAAGHDSQTARRSALEGELQGLRESPEMRDADRLDEASRAADEMDARAAREGGHLERDRAALERETREEEAAVARFERASAQAQGHDESAVSSAAAAGLAAEHPTIATDPQAARRALDRRRDQVRHVRGLLDRARTAIGRATQLRAALDAAESETVRRREETQTAEADVVTAVEAHRTDVWSYLGGLVALVVPEETEQLAGRLREWGTNQLGESPARVAVEAAAASALEQLGRERAAAEQVAQRLDTDLSQVRREIERLEAGADPEPPAVSGRDPHVRDGASGAPLWRVTDFSTSVSPQEAAGLEAALQSAGLLDAWVFPDGTLSAAGDVVLSSQGVAVERPSSSVLVAAVGPGDDLPPSAVTAVLDRIGLEETSGAALWVSPSGQWGAGPARGSWRKPQAEYVGAGARKAHRQAVLDRTRARAAELEDELAGIRGRIASVEHRSEQVRAERTGYPTVSERALVSAHGRAAAARRELERAASAEEGARDGWQRAADAADVAADDLAGQAAELGLGESVEALDEAMETIGSYERALLELRTSTQALADAREVRDRAAGRVAEVGERVAQQTASWQELRERAAALRSRFEALQATVGASVAQLQEKVAGVQRSVEQVADELQRISAQQLVAASEHGSLVQRVEDLRERREDSDRVRREEVDGLRAFTTTGLLRVALPALQVPEPGSVEEWSMTAALALSREAEQHLDGAEESADAWAGAQQRVSHAATELAGQMSRHGHTAYVEQHDDVMVARVRYLGDEVDVDRLADRLADDVAERERLLSAREREILENHLVNEVAGHLHELLLAAEGQIERMNRELAERKTSTGMQLRVRWRERSDGPAGLTAARELMLRSDATWTPQDRSAIGGFLQAQIAEARQADPTAGWQEHLERALDYRQWHHFSVERYQTGQWRSASGPASGGEKALAVSVPLFAAASAHYNSAGPLAPRLILLDEAFAGVDDDSRAKSLGLLATFDLDVVMTSEREWGCYPQVPGLAIAQLSRVEGIDAVGVTRWRWDGRRRERLAEVAGTARAGADSGSESGSQEESLFG